MKKIIAIIALLFAVTSCGTSTDVEKVTSTESQSPVEVSAETDTKIVDLTPDEEKIVEDLLK